MARLLYEGPWVAERYAATKALIESQPEAFHPTTLKIISGAKGLTAVSAFEAMYKLADLKRQTAPIFDRVDCLAVATVPRMYTLAEVEAEPIALNSNLGSYTNFVNLLDLAAISVPVGKRSDGLPSSLTLIGRAGTDGYLASIAAKLHGESVAAPARAVAPRIEIAVVGAHLSGLPLNHELTSAGGAFVRDGRDGAGLPALCAAQYDAAEAGAAARGGGAGRGDRGRGLVARCLRRSARSSRRSRGRSASARCGFSDGTEAKGFLVEAEAVRGARDISEFGGWANFLKAGR